MLRKMHCTKDARISGIVTFHMACEGVQPSIIAASLRASETLMKPAT